MHQIKYHRGDSFRAIAASFGHKTPEQKSQAQETPFEVTTQKPDPRHRSLHPNYQR